MSNLVINQHYVPQRYLKHFANITKKKNKTIARLNVYDKEKAETRTNQNIERVASERFFYDVDFDAIINEAEEEGIEINQEYKSLVEQVDKQTIEHILATKIENSVFNPIAKIVTSYIMTQKKAYANTFVIPVSERAEIAYYLSLQLTRTKEFREKLIQTYEKGALLLLKKSPSEKVDKQFLNDIELKLKKNHINLYHNLELMDAEKHEDYSMCFLKHIWFIAVNETPTSFWTSDNPLVLYGHLGNHGLKSRDVEIVFPINSKLALVMRELEHFSKDIYLYNRFAPVNEDYVKYCNTLQVHQSYRCVFSKDSDFSLANEIIRENPDLQNMSRDRFLIG
jgi:type III secretion system FlhB-like substrate exporter